MIPEEICTVITFLALKFEHHSIHASVKLGNHSVSFATTKNRTENKTTEFNTCIDKMPASIWTTFSVKNCDEYQLSEGHLLEMKTIDDCVDYGF